MYCMKCGAHLSDTEIKCPLCSFELPKLSPVQEKSLYPRKARPRTKEDFKALMLFVTLLLVGLGSACLALDLSHGGGVTFSAFVILGLLLFYTAFLLPRWFHRPNPVIFLPVFFLCFLGFLWYLDFLYGGGWFFPFALPVSGAFLLLTEAVVTLIRYVRGGRLYIYGGYLISLGLFSFGGEFLLRYLYALPMKLTWSLIPLIFLSSIGMALIVIAIVPAFRSYFERRFFV